MDKPHPKRRPREGWEEQFRKMGELGDDRLIDDFWAEDKAGNSDIVTFDRIVDLASRLSREERVRLVMRIEADLNAAPYVSAANDSPPGSAMAILQTMREPPHLSAEDVDALKQAIADGKLAVRHEGVFDSVDGLNVANWAV
jgi:hypothetical protein